MHETPATDFIKQTTDNAIRFRPETTKATRYLVELEMSIYWKYYDTADDAMKFKLPVEKRAAANFLERLVEDGYSVGVI